MKNLDLSTNESKIIDHILRILIIGGFWSGKANALLKLVTN